MMIERDGQDVHQAVLRLAFFDPGRADEFGHQALDYLILDALAAHGQVDVTPSEVVRHIQDVFHLQFEEVEVVSAAKHLSSSSLIDLADGIRDTPASLRIRKASETRIQRNLSYVRDIERAVLDGWTTELREKYEEYPAVAENLPHLVALLQLFMARMFTVHGVECVALICPDEARTKSWLNSVKTGIFDTLPAPSNFIDAVARLEIPLFFSTRDQQRREYVTSLLNSSFFWHLIQVDENCSRLLRTVTRGQQLFLDNNVLYSLVGLHGTDLLVSTHNMLRISRGNWGTSSA